MSETSTPAPPATGPASAPPARPAPSAAPAQTPAQVPGMAAGSTSGSLAEPDAAKTSGPPAAEQDPSGLAAKLEGELAQLRADAIAGEKAILRVLAPHSSMTWNGITVTDEPTQVPAHAVAGLTEAAASAGVNLTQEH